MQGQERISQIGQIKHKIESARHKVAATIATATVSTLLIACGDKDIAASPHVDQRPTAPGTVTSTWTPDSPLSPTATAVATKSATPTATPTPFAGDVARLRVPDLKIDAPTINVGLKPDGGLADPERADQVGWYKIYDRPGWDGNAVFAAHLNRYPNLIGAFNRLSEAKEGQEIIVVMANNQEYKYRVIRTARYSDKDIPMGDLIWPQNKPAGAEWVTLITCGGASVPIGGGRVEYLSRDVVIAERIK